MESAALERRIEPIEPPHVALRRFGDIAPRGKIAQFCREIEAFRRLRLGHGLPSSPPRPASAADLESCAIGSNRLP